MSRLRPVPRWFWMHFVHIIFKQQFLFPLEARPMTLLYEIHAWSLNQLGAKIHNLATTSQISAVISVVPQPTTDQKKNWSRVGRRVFNKIASYYFFFLLRPPNSKQVMPSKARDTCLYLSLTNGGGQSYHTSFTGRSYNNYVLRQK